MQITVRGVHFQLKGCINGKTHRTVPCAMSTVGANRKAIQEYIKNQLQEDYSDDQMSIKEYVDPFTGQPVQGANKQKPL